jgi:hypothetical protein
MNDDTLEDAVRAALEPEADAVDRVVRGALGQHQGWQPVRGRLLVVAGAAVLMVAGVLVLNRGTWMTGPTPTRVTNIGNTIVVKPVSGGVWLVGGDGQKDDSLPSGTIVVFRPGETQ